MSLKENKSFSKDLLINNSSNENRISDELIWKMKWFYVNVYRVLRIFFFFDEIEILIFFLKALWLFFVLYTFPWRLCLYEGNIFISYHFYLHYDTMSSSFNEITLHWYNIEDLNPKIWVLLSTYTWNCFKWNSILKTTFP